MKNLGTINNGNGYTEKIYIREDCDTHEIYATHDKDESYLIAYVTYNGDSVHAVTGDELAEIENEAVESWLVENGYAVRFSCEYGEGLTATEKMEA